jgi:hypothetical protein
VFRFCHCNHQNWLSKGHHGGFHQFPGKIRNKLGPRQGLLLSQMLRDLKISDVMLLYPGRLPVFGTTSMDNNM